MKGPMFCASQASTAICSSMDHIHRPTTATVAADKEDKSSSRAIDRHNPIIKDGRRSSVDDYIRIPASPAEGEMISNKTLEIYKGRRSFTGRKSTGGGGGGGAAALLKLITSDISLARKSFSCVARPACDLTKTPPGSTRFLLGGSEPVSLNGSEGQDPVKEVALSPKPPASEEIKPVSSLTEEKTSGSGSGSDQEEKQVVVLKVSLHCRGCEAKVRKHLSRMQGVTSFNIDFVAKKVTVTGDITPLEILDSISKVKNAQFWTTPTLPLPNLQTPNP
ncbi:Chloroplast-targeted copper chaperone protein [Raphanus sativus]|uniref:Protein SODIUM POTASSIUM ROOT DEFECTIVE 2 n=1 Tax=Raphanus sativus TaxID=3726 RepID=A0A6J0JCF7_RAPSA|nr:protein SODIUM POTASSIUM ROOT DEFECTIVE 2 [Raphanus sativus]KAJ4891825.1 Chloroplast-targeted copper chaperone protein [Raphanus sativus]